jgi:hypothetical protein
MDDDRAAMPAAAEEARPACRLELTSKLRDRETQSAARDPTVAEVDRAIDELAQSSAAPFAAPCLATGR